MGRRLTATVRSGDFAARLGGDEFAVVLDLDDARRAAARLAAAIATPVLVDDVEVPVGVSLLFGDIEAALGAADHNLYAQKAAHRESGTTISKP